MLNRFHVLARFYELYAQWRNARTGAVVTAKVPKNATKKPIAPKKMTSATVASPNKRTSVSTEREIKEEIKNRNLLGNSCHSQESCLYSFRQLPT